MLRTVGEHPFRCPASIEDGGRYIPPGRCPSNKPAWMGTLGCRSPPDSQRPRFGSNDLLLWREQADGAGEQRSKSQNHQVLVEGQSHALLPAHLSCVYTGKRTFKTRSKELPKSAVQILLSGLYNASVPEHHRIIKVGKDLSDLQVQPSPQHHHAC